MAEAFARVGESAASPDPGSPPVVGDQPPAATVQAQPETPPVEAVPTPEIQGGPIPIEKHKRILENARVKTEQEVTQRFQQQYAPHVEFGEKFRAAPVETLVQAVNELAQHPEMGPQVISALARTLGARRGQSQTAPVATEDAPQADLQTADGTLVYSAEQLAKREAWFQKQMLSQVDQRLSPLQQREQAAQAAEKRDAMWKDSTARMGRVLEPYLTSPELKEHMPVFKEKVQALMQEGKYSASEIPGVAYAQVLREVVLPSRAAQSRNDLVAQAVAKSTGSTTAPGTAPAAPSKRPTSMSDAFSRIAM